VDFATMMALEPHGTDVWVGTGPRYPWGGLYGGQIVAQGLRAGTFTVDDDFRVHSLHAYFIRSGDHTEPIRFEVDRVRNGRSFLTRRVTARQSVGVILEMTASYQVDEDATEVQTATVPPTKAPEDLADDSWSPLFDRRMAPRRRGDTSGWLKVADAIGDDPALQACGLAYLSDDLPTEAVVSLHPDSDPERPFEDQFMSASLDHAIYFHRPVAADEWNLQAFGCHGLMSSRGVSVGYVFTREGTHVATIVQEVLLRKLRRLPRETAPAG
jgi:acyl-CoA thioesterase-2